MALFALSAGAGPMASAWRAYSRAARRSPLLVNMATSGALWAAGDVVSQHVQRVRNSRGAAAHEDECAADSLHRTACAGAFGGLVFGPLGHAWYAWLEGIVAGFAVPGSTAFIVAKVLADTLIWTPVYVGLFMAYSSVMINNAGPSGVVKKLREDFLPTVAAEGVVWPPIMALLFACVPLSHQLLAVNAMTVADVAFLTLLEDADVSQLAASVGGLLGLSAGMMTEEAAGAAGAAAAVHRRGHQSAARLNVARARARA